MGFIKFSDWVLARESSPATRLRNASALGLMPPIPAASINSHSTAPAWQRDSLLKKSRPKKKRKSGRKKDDGSPKNKAIDAFVRSVEELEDDLEKLAKSGGKPDKDGAKAKDKEQKGKTEVDKEQKVKDESEEKDEEEKETKDKSSSKKKKD